MTPIFFPYKTIGSLAVPPGLFVLLCLLMALSAMRSPRRPRLAVALAATGILIYSTSCEWSARLITGSLEDMYQSHPLPTAEEKAVIVILGGGVRYHQDLSPFELGPYTASRVLAAYRLSQGTGWPILCCGGNPRSDPDPSRSEAHIMARTLREMGISEVYEEGRSRTTWENLRNASNMLRRMETDRVVLVTNAFHMPRAMLTARQSLKGFQVYPYQSGRLTDKSPLNLMCFLPNSTSMAESALGLREWVGLGAYRVFGLFNLFKMSPEAR